MQHIAIVRAGGLAFITGALAFVGVFSYLAANFNYPDVLEGAAAEVLPALRDGGDTMRAVWALYAMLPLLLIPGAVGAWAAVPASRRRMTLALVLAAIASLSMCLGLMRWPSVHWALAGAYAQAQPAVQASLNVLFDGLNLYLGNYIGEFLGETLLAGFFLLTAVSMRTEARYPAWLFYGGAAFALLFFIGAFRNVTGSVQAVADLNNILLPLWMIALGVGMIRHARE
jgi:hypothetical protein